MATEFDFEYRGDPMMHPFVKERVSDFNKRQVDALMKANSSAYKNAPQKSEKFPVRQVFSSALSNVAQAPLMVFFSTP